MDVNLWKVVLFEWIKTSELIDVLGGTLEHVQINDFSNKLYEKVFENSKKNRGKIVIENFIQENFPEYEILYDETNNISSQDHVYIYSLLLYYSCVTQENEFFQKCCKKLNQKYQLAIVSFLTYFNDVRESVTKESIRCAIKRAVSTISPNKPTKFCSIMSSPFKTPRKSDSSPPTPNKEYINTKLKELKTLKSQLETERFERNMLELDMKQYKEKNDNLVRKIAALTSEIQSLRLEITVEKQSENLSPNKNQREHQIRNKMQKEIQTRDNIISNLKIENDNIRCSSKKYQQKICIMDKQIKEMLSKMRDLDASVDELTYYIKMRDEKIQMLEEEKKDLMEIVHEFRSNSCKDSSSSSSDLLEYSNSFYHTINNSFSFAESLGKSVVDIQLKEKESEIIKLKEMISIANIEKTDLELKVSSLLKTIKVLENKVNQESSREVSEKLKEIESLYMELSDMSARNENFSKEVEIQQELITTLSKDRDLHKNNVQHSRNIIEKLQGEFQKIYSQTEKDQEKIKASESARKSIENLLEAEKALSQQQRENFEHKIYELDEKIKELKYNMDIKLSEKEDLIAEAKEQVFQLKELKEKMKVEINMKNTEISRLEKLVEETGAKHNNQMIEQENKLQISSKDLSELNVKIDLKNTEISRLEKLIEKTGAKHNNQMIEQENKLQISSKDLSELKVDIDLKNTEISRLEKLIEETDEKHSKQMIEQEEKLQISSKDLSELKVEIDLKNTEISRLEKLIEETDEKHSKQMIEQENKLQISSKDLSELKVEINLKNTEISRLEKLIEETDEKHSKQMIEQEEKLQISSKDLSELKVEIDLKNTEISRLEKLIEETDAKHSNQMIEQENKLQISSKDLSELKVEIDLKNTEISQLEKLIEENNAKHSKEMEELKDKLQINSNSFSALELTHEKLSAIHEREKIFSDKLSEDMLILRAKLEKSRIDLKTKEEEWKNEREKFQLEKELDKKKYEKEIHDHRIHMEEKLRDLKQHMKHLYIEGLKKIQIEADEKIQKTLQEKEILSQIVHENEGLIQELKIQLNEYKRENGHLLSKVKFLDNNNSCIQSSNENFDIPQRFPTYESEKFDNAFLNELKSGMQSGVILEASVLQERNSKVPMHLRDSYAVSALDKNLSEHEMKFGKGNLQDSVDDKQHKKSLSITTPMKFLARLSFGGNSSQKSVLKDSTNVNSIEKKEPASGRKKSLFSSFTKNKDELNGNRNRRVKKNARTLTPKNFKNYNQNWIIDRHVEDDDDERRPTMSKSSRKTIELDRKRKRNIACDLNRPNLNDNCDDTVIIEEEEDFNGDCNINDDDTDWIEEDIDDNNSKERISNSSKHDKSLEHIIKRENNVKRQQKMRRKSFNNNRRSSLLVKHKITTEITTQAVRKRSSDDWDKYTSCTSLKSDSFVAPQDSFETPKKSCMRNFVDTHFAEVNRISDYYVNSKIRFPNDSHADEIWNCDLREFKPLPIIVISLLTIGLLSAAYYNFSRRD